jgi:hypothetical protein
MLAPLREVFPVRRACVIVRVMRHGRAAGQQQDHGKYADHENHRPAMLLPNVALAVARKLSPVLVGVRQ